MGSTVLLQYCNVSGAKLTLQDHLQSQSFSFKAPSSFLLFSSLFFVFVQELCFIHRSCSTVGYRPHVQSTTLGHLLASHCAHLLPPLLRARGKSTWKCLLMQADLEVPFLCKSGFHFLSNWSLHAHVFVELWVPCSFLFYLSVDAETVSEEVERCLHKELGLFVEFTGLVR